MSLSRSQKQAVKEVLDACRMHERAVNELRTRQGIRDGQPCLPDIEEGLAISAAKLELVLKEDARPFSRKRNAAVLKAIAKALKAYVDGLKDIARKCGEAARRGKILLTPSKVIYFQQAANLLAEAAAVVRTATLDKSDCDAPLREWSSEMVARHVNPIRIDCRPVTAVTEEAEAHDAALSVARTVKDALDCC